MDEHAQTATTAEMEEAPPALIFEPPPRPLRRHRAALLLGGLLMAAVVGVLVLQAAQSGHRSDHKAAAALIAPSPASAPYSLTPPAPVALGGGWQIRPDPGDLGLTGGWAAGDLRSSGWSPALVPGVFNPHVNRASDTGRVVWYRLRFTAPAALPGRSWAVAFEGVRRHATVWLNGTNLGSSSDPFAPFSLPASSLRSGQPNVLVLRVDNLKGPGSLPEDWWNWGGITGPVKLQPVGQVALSQLGVMPALGCRLTCATLTVEGVLRNTTSVTLRPRLRISVSDPGGASVADVTRDAPALAPGASRPVVVSVALAGAPKLWSPTSPSLYRVRVDTEAGSRIEQRDTLRTGLRTVAVRGGMLLLNDRRLWLHGAAIHEDMPGRGAAISDGDIATIVSELRSAGANITRAHYLLSPRLLSALDAAGIMIWAQPPVDHADAVLARPSGRLHALALLRSTLLGDRSHPSVIVNAVGNELTPTPDSSPGVRDYLFRAVRLSRTISPSLPVALDTYCYTNFPAQRVYAELDVLGISSYFGWYRGRPGHPIDRFAQLAPFLTMTHARYPHLALVVSEFGAEGVFDGAPSVKGSYAFQNDYLRQTLTVVDALPFMSGSIYWTVRDFAVVPGWRGGADLPAGLQPTGIHHKGLIAYDGAPKPAYSVASALLPQVPAFVR